MIQKEKDKKEVGQNLTILDMEEWDGNSYKGVGIKRMKGYKCNLSINK